MQNLQELAQQVAGAVENLTYSQTEKLKQQLEVLSNTASDDEKQKILAVISQAQEAMKEIEHQIWVQSRECSEELADTLVPTIPDSIMLTLAGAPEHEGKPRLLVQTKAFKDRLATLK